VQVTHGNLLHNSVALQRMARLDEHSVYVSWLPQYHDMGLIGGLLQPIHGGSGGMLMSPLSFLEKPVRWLEAISRFRGTVSPFPNFALDLCVRKVTAEQKKGLDLSSWQVAINGAEPVRWRSLESFSDAFRECGFRATAHFPAYGLAEATLIVSGPAFGAGPRTLLVDRDALARNEARPANGGSAATVVSCGRGLPDQAITVVDPETRTELPEGRVGEIWVSGESVAKGYWNRPEETTATFGATLGGRSYLRTGDLGFIDGGDLFIAGRLKDLIIIRGANHYPQDIEATAEAADPRVRKGCVAAFSLEASGAEHLALAAEVAAGATGLEQLMTAVREAVGREHGVALHTLALLGPGTISKTSSGKIQRRATRSALLDGALSPLAQWTSQAARAAADEAAAPATSDEEQLAQKLAALLARHLELPVEEIDLDADVRDYGLDSLMAVELASSIQLTLSRQLGVDDLWSNPTLRQLARRIAKVRG
jgi:acyl-CoA synthetase (AMP-forming)/AMP-acid ligase II/acyl carrier protein